MTNITFYRGLRTIGGTLVGVETENTRCFFDFGYIVNDRLDPKISERKGHIVSDKIRLGLCADIDGIYAKEEISDLLIKGFDNEGKKTFFLISHMHIDHMQGLGMLDQEIPVYMSKESLTLYKELGRQGEYDYRMHENCVAMEYDIPLIIGDITVTAAKIDHDIIGACGFLIKTEEGDIAYTGDYRLHGYHPEYTREFAKKAADTDVLITEGVTVSFDDVDMLALDQTENQTENVCRTEYDLLDEVKNIAKDVTKLLVINPYNRNVERVYRIAEMLKKAGRTLLMDSVQAAYVAVFYPDFEISVYEPTAGEENQFLKVTREELKEHPEKYVLQLAYENMYELLDLDTEGGIYMHCDGAPLGAYDPSFEKMKSLIEMLGMEYRYMGLGGHAKPASLKEILDTIKAVNLVPLHSFRPEQVVCAYSKQILPKTNQTFSLENHQLKACE